MPGRFFLLSMLLLVAAAFAYLTGNGRAPLFDRDEPRYAITSRNMLLSGDYVVPRQYDSPRTAKPPLIYWLQASSMRLFGTDSAFAARLPSSVAMFCVVLLLLLFLRRETDDETALVATALFAFAGLTGFLAKFAITDAVLLLSVAVSAGCLYRWWRGDRRWRVVLLWAAATGVSGLTKGPIGPAIQVMTLLALWAMSLIDRRFPAQASWTTYPLEGVATPAETGKATGMPLKLGIALVVIAAIVLPWLVAVTIREPSFLSKALNHDIVARSTRGVDGQARPPGFYLLTVFGTYFPWSILIPGGLVLGWKNRHRPLTRFCFAMCAGPWLMFEASTSKMVHWFLPVFVPLSVLCGQAVVWCRRGRYDDFTQKPFVWAAGVWAVITLLLGLALWAAVTELPPTPLRLAVGLMLWATLTAAAGFWFFFRARTEGTGRRVNLLRAVGVLGGAMAVLFPLVFSVIVPGLWFMRLGQSVGEDLRRRGAVGVGNVIMVGYREPSMAFYQGGTVREAEIAALSTSTASWATVTTAVWDRVDAATRARWAMVSSHRGVAYADEPDVIEVLVLKRR